MAITVETGAIVAGANSYVSVVDLDAYLLLRGMTTSLDKEVMLIKAMDWLEIQKYKGDQLTCDQVLQFPRVNVIISRLCYIESDEIPEQLKQFQLRIAAGISEGFDPTAYRERAALMEDDCAGGKVEYLKGSLDVYIPNTKEHRFIELLRPKNVTLRI